MGCLEPQLISVVVWVDLLMSMWRWSEQDEDRLSLALSELVNTWMFVTTYFSHQYGTFLDEIIVWKMNQHH